MKISSFVFIVQASSSMTIINSSIATPRKTAAAIYNSGRWIILSSCFQIVDIAVPLYLLPHPVRLVFCSWPFSASASSDHPALPFHSPPFTQKYERRKMLEKRLHSSGLEILSDQGEKTGRVRTIQTLPIWNIELFSCTIYISAFHGIRLSSSS